MGEEDESDDMSGNMSPVDDTNQEVSQKHTHLVPVVYPRETMHSRRGPYLNS